MRHKTKANQKHEACFASVVIACLSLRNSFGICTISVQCCLHSKHMATAVREKVPISVYVCVLTLCVAEFDS